MNNLSIYAVCAGTLLLAPAFSVLSNESYDEVLITGTRTEVPVAESLSSATVIDSDELETLQPQDLVDVFHQLPGADITRDGGLGSASSVFMRGTAGDQTLFLVDGQRIDSATLGSANFQFLDPSQIDRVEVVRGATSSLYGSDAIGGVIQVFTKDGAEGGGSYVTPGAGSNNLQSLAAGTNGAAGDFRYGLNLSHLETDGIDNHVDDTGHNSDDDGYRNQSVNANMGYSFTDGGELSLSVLRSDSRNEYDSAMNPAQKPYTDALLQNVNAKLRLPVTDVWQSQLSMGTARDHSTVYDEVTGQRDSHFRTERKQLFWQNHFSVTDTQTFTLGYDFYEDRVESSSAYEDAQGTPVEARDNRALFAQHQARLGRFDLLLGFREDDNEEFGSHGSGNVALGYQLDGQHKLVASWSEGFKAPTFNDLYWPAGPFSAGNPNLSPETSENYELSLRGRYNSGYWTVSYFENDIDNLIDWATGNDGILRPYNVNNAEITGGELLAGTTLDGWRFEGSLSYTDPVDAEQGTVLPNRAKRTALLNVDKTLDRWNLGLSFKAQSERHLSGTTDTLPGYGTMGVRVGYQHNDQLLAQFKVDNLFDRDYQLNPNYNQIGANWHLNVTYSM